MAWLHTKIGNSRLKRLLDISVGGWSWLQTVRLVPLFLKLLDLQWQSDLLVVMLCKTVSELGVQDLCFEQDPRGKQPTGHCSLTEICSTEPGTAPGTCFAFLGSLASEAGQLLVLDQWCAPWTGRESQALLPEKRLTPSSLVTQSNSPMGVWT